MLNSLNHTLVDLCAKTEFRELRESLKAQRARMDQERTNPPNLLLERREILYRCFFLALVLTSIRCYLHAQIDSINFWRSLANHQTRHNGRFPTSGWPFLSPVATETSFSSSTFSPTTPTLRASVWSSSSAALHSPKQIQAAKTATLFSISDPISSKTPPFNSDITSYRSTQSPTTVLRGNFQTDLSRSFSRVRVVEKNLVPVTIRANQVNFKAKREVKIPFREGECAANDYLKETERVVQVTFPDSSRIEYMGDQKWRSRLRPITFFSISATPIVEMRVSFEKGVLCLQSDKLVLDFTGVPDDFAVQDFQFALNGNLRVIPRAVQVKQARPICDFAGSVSLGLGTNLPLAFSLIPEGIVTRVGDEILDRIIGAMEGALLKGIISDYSAWCRLKSKKSRSTSPQPAPLRTSRS